MSNFSENSNKQSTEDDTINLKQYFVKIFDKWHWFLISAIICLFLSFLYIKYTAPSYRINAKLLVNDDDKGAGLGKQAGALMDLGGILGSKSSVDNEAEILKTRFLMEQVVREMQLNIVYKRNSGFISRELPVSPFKLEIIKSVDTIAPTVIRIEKLTNDRLRIIADDSEQEVKWNQSFNIANVGSIRFLREPGVDMQSGSYSVDLSSIDEKVSELMKQLSVAVSNKQVTIIDMGLTYSLRGRGEEILTTLISKYTSGGVSDKNAIADSTYKFIRQRINAIASELGDVENQVESFKQTNKLADMSEQSKLLVQNTGEFTSELAKAETQVSILNDLESYLIDESKNKRVFPTQLLPQDMIFSGLMSQYNTLLIERDRQLLSVTETSPFIKNIDDQIAGLRSGILANIKSTKNTYVLTRNKLRSQLSQAEGKIVGVPQIEKNYLKLARNQQIKQELYIFLMQKAEETAISKTSNITVAKVIDPAKAEVKPVSPQKPTAFLIGLVVGLIIPLGVIIATILLNTAVSTKEDIINQTSVPVIGEISHNTTVDNLIVANQGRSAISEQFRALRTNLSFYLKGEGGQFILLTSSMSGEGKSFTAINLGNILSLAGKKVLLMELDLRKPGLSAKLGVQNTLGFSNYVIDTRLKSADIIKKLDINENMYMISSGPLPPNPAETLMNDRTKQLLKELKESFDYIIMDAPPIGIITDAQLISEYADAVIYLVRQKVTQKSQLAIVDDLHRNSKMKNLGIVVNDIVNKQYGYGYGYGVYGQEQELNWFQKLVSKRKG